MKINTYWRSFVIGRNQTILVEVIQDGIKAFFEFVKIFGYMEGDPISHLPFRKISASDYKAAMVGTDLAEINKIFQIEFKFKRINSRQRIIGFPHHLRRALGNDKYRALKNEGNKNIWKIERFDDFLRSAQEIIRIRNVNAHNQKEINDTGWALKVAGHVFNLIELSPTPLKVEKVELLKSNGIKLLDQIIETEGYYEDEEDEEQFATDQTQSNQAPNIDRIESVIEGKLDEVMQFIESSINQSFDQINTSITNIPSMLDVTREKMNEPEARVVEEKAYDSNLDDEDFYTGPEEMTTYNQLMAELAASEDKKSVEIVSDRLTPAQADRELLMLQKQLKQEFKCKNLENIAQGPFRKQILENKIQNIEQWLQNEFIRSRYEEHQNEMVQQTSSELGEQYFSILGRIVWND